MLINNKIFDCYPIDGIAQAEISEFYSHANVILKKYPRKRDLVKDFLRTGLGRVASPSYVSRKTNAKDQYEEIWTGKTILDVFGDGGTRDLGIVNPTNILFKGGLIGSEMWSLNASIVSTFASYLRGEGKTKVKILEIGSGNGFNLISLAAQFPDREFIGLELTEAGVLASVKAMKDTRTVTNLCDFVFGSNNKYSGEPLKNIKFIQEDVTRLNPKAFSTDLILSVLAQEQMEQVYEEFKSAIKKMKDTDFLFFEPYLDFNSAHQSSILKTKKYLYRASLELELFLDIEIQKLTMPMKIDKQKFSFGILKGKTN